MSQFSIDEFTRVTISSVNVRSEMHGADHVPAMDIKMEWTTSNDVLSEFDGALKSMLYQPSANGDGGQEVIEGMEQSDMPSLRSTILGPFKLKKEYAGYELAIYYGIDQSKPILIAGCEADKFVVDAKEGGSVSMQMRVQASGIEPRVLGLVGSLVGQEVEITFTAPEA